MAAAETCLSCSAGNNFEPYEPATTASCKKSPNSSTRRFYSTKNLQFELMRLVTFEGWPVKFINTGDLAKAGFSYLHRDDMVQCHFCGGVVAYWEPDDVPSIEHEKHYPNCPFMKGSAVNNVPMDGSSVSAVLQRYVLSRLDEGGDIPKRKRLYQTDEAVLAHGEAQSKADQFPDFASPKKRMATFVDPSPNVPNSEKMVSAGFFLVGLSDMAQCYACGGGVFNWTSNEDPRVIHETLYPQCRLVETTQKQKKTETKSTSRRTLDKSEEKELLNMTLSKKLLKFGWSEELIMAALSNELYVYGTLPADMNEATDVLMDYEETLNS